MSVWRDNSVKKSLFGLPPLSLEEDHSSSSSSSSSSSQTLVPPPRPHDLDVVFNSLKPTKVLDIAGDKRNSGHIDLMSCTESLGFESSDEMISSFDDLACFNNNCNNDDSSSSSSLSSSSSYCCRREKRVSERNFPPPLTSLSENGRRNFTLKSTRKDGRLEIVAVMTQHPEILYASRDNGRLRLHLIQDVYNDHDDDNNEYQLEQQTEEIEQIEENDEDGEEFDEGGEEAEETPEEEEEEEREWKVPAARGLRRWCYQQRGIHAWGPQQLRYVTTI